MDEQHSRIVRRELGFKIRELRKGQDISLRDFATMIGLSYPYLSNIENGKQAATVDTLDRIAQGLDVPIRDLF